MNNTKIPISPPKEDTMEGRLIKLLGNYCCIGDNYVFPDGTLFTAGIDVELGTFLEEYNRLDLWRIPTLEGIPPHLTSNSEDEDEDEDEDEEYASYDYYLLDFYEHFESSRQVCYSILKVGFIVVGGYITIDENIPTDFLDRWLINALDKNWEATPDDDNAWNNIS